jgi:hypothetical protein
MLLPKIKILSAVIAFAFLLTPLVATPVANSLDQKSNLCGGAELRVKSGNCAGDGTARLNSVVGNIVNVLSVIVGIVAVIMIIIGGFKYITSGGDSGSITSAKHTILYAIVGLVVVALAQFIVRFVLDKST